MEICQSCQTCLNMCVIKFGYKRVNFMNEKVQPVKLYDN